LSTWFLFMFSYMFYCISYILLGGHNCDPTPPPTLCHLQAGLVYCAPVLAATSTLSYVLDVFIGLVTHLWQVKVPASYVVWLRTAPIVITVLVLIEALLVALESDVGPNSTHMYCHITSNTPSTVTAIVICFPLILVLMLQAWIAVILSRHWLSFRKLSKQGIPGLLSLAALLRIGGFSVLMPIIVTILTAASIVETVKHPDSHAAGWDFVLPILPITAALVFGTQKDILKIWSFQKAASAVQAAPLGGPKQGPDSELKGDSHY